MLKQLGSLALTLGLMSTAWADDKDAKGFDVNKLVGEWTYVTGVRGGDKIEKERMAGKVTFTKDTVTLASDQAKFVMKFTIDGKKSPATIDLEIKEGPVNEGKAKGIIELKDKELKLCYVPEGAGDRPAKFESTKGSAAFCFTLKPAK